MPSRPGSCPQLLGLAVHEFRTPVGVVAGYVRMLLKYHQEALGEAQRQLLEETERSCERLAALIAGLSDLANLEAGTVTLRAQRVDLFGLARDVASSVPEGRDRGVRTEVRGAEQSAGITGDFDRLRAALQAVVTGVLRERVTACTVLLQCGIRATADRPTAWILVGDEALVHRRWDSIPRGWGRFNEWRGGLGFVLPTAARVIALHGGRLWSPRGEAARGAAAISLPLPEATRDLRAGSREPKAVLA
jgi:signal transduction histidine kinase